MSGVLDVWAEGVPSDGWEKNGGLSLKRWPSELGLRGRRDPLLVLVAYTPEIVRRGGGRVSLMSQDLSVGTNEKRLR